MVFSSIFIRHLNQTELSFPRSGDYTPVIESRYNINKPLHRKYTTSVLIVIIVIIIVIRVIIAIIVIITNIVIIVMIIVIRVL